MGILHETAYYSGSLHASRFPVFWFSPVLLAEKQKIRIGERTSLPEMEVDRLYRKYMAMVTEDLATAKPDTVLIWFPPDRRDTDLLAFFSDYSPFLDEWKKYGKAGTLMLDFDDYYKKIGIGDFEASHYDIYRRNVVE